ncbi:hypothetical protein QNM99_19830, partial [Pseudomonas sp. PCH446]
RGTIIHMRRPDAPAVNPHISESGICMLEPDLIVDNAGPLSALRAKLTNACTSFATAQTLSSLRSTP